VSIPPPSCQIDANEVGASFQKKGTGARSAEDTLSDVCEIVDWGQSGPSPFLNRECRWCPKENPKKREDWFRAELLLGSFRDGSA